MRRACWGNLLRSHLLAGRHSPSTVRYWSGRDPDRCGGRPAAAPLGVTPYATAAHATSLPAERLRGRSVAEVTPGIDFRTVEKVLRPVRDGTPASRSDRGLG